MEAVVSDISIRINVIVISFRNDDSLDVILIRYDSSLLLLSALNTGFIVEVKTRKQAFTRQEWIGAF
jgi:hypothetical protein